ncbi:probable glycerol-3-phosphate acyltransferase 2 [Phalaenopsis equestris]|uniref:probable glycerol-3-phosphate acyltransferase 2 n=1 Tax=Phalaenopsis equestris TaxID=78828 RepID=UPI0009E4228F|nr:probable glycerol-3-phosphate acyltransferase 2 [Phalaenopsis equestris]
MPLRSCSLSVLCLSNRFFKLLTKSLFHHQRTNSIPNSPKNASPSSLHTNGILILPSQTLIFNFEGWLLKSSSAFPYFMVVAFEACSLFRSLLLLFLYPLVCCMKNEAGLKMMVLVCFFGVKKENLRVARVALFKFFMEHIGEEEIKVLRSGRRRMGVSNMPKVMVESFLKDYMETEVVIGRELKEFCGFYTGFMDWKREEMIMVINGEDALRFGSSFEDIHHKEVHRISEAEKSRLPPLPQEKYPKSLIFHDGRIAFLPTPSATLAMFLWLPFGVILSIIRHIIGMFCPYSISIPIGALTGMVNRHNKNAAAELQPQQKIGLQTDTNCSKSTRGRLFICNHRTLLDPVYISVSLKKQVTAVVYSLSPISEILSPIKTVRLTRNKEEDRKKMEKLLSHGDLVVCPEGTTCREPYLLRFSPLFAELADQITPVALNVQVSMFYGTTACGFKWLDSFYFLMNPRPMYVVQFLDEISVVSAGKTRYSPCEVANRAQEEIGRCLGFECTMLTRKDKYQILAGNDGVMQKKQSI